MAITLEDGYKRADKLFKASMLQAERAEYLAALPLNGDMEVLLKYNESLGDKPESGHGPEINLTDLGNAERLINRYGKILRFCYERQHWLIWNDKYWEWDSGSRVAGLAKSTVRSIYGEAADEEDDKLRKEIVSHGKSSESDHRLTALVHRASLDPAINVKVEQLDANPWLLNCQNGTLNLKTGELKPFNPTDMITAITTVEYDPGATSELWTQFLNKRASCIIH